MEGTRQHTGRTQASRGPHLKPEHRAKEACQCQPNGPMDRTGRPTKEEDMERLGMEEDHRDHRIDQTGQGLVRTNGQWPADAPRVERFGFTSGAGNATVREHDNVTLQCDVTSNPGSSIEINNTTSSIGSSRTSNPDRQTLTTMLLHVSCLEGGNYICAARNLIGEASQTVPLQVRCVPRRYSFSSETLVFTSGLHENVTLSLTVIAFPQPTFTWRRRSNTRPISTTAVTTEGVLVTGSVTIFDVKEEDYINYTVSVTNTEGYLDLEIPLVSKSRPHLPSNLKAVNISPRSVTLTWEKGFNGGAKQMFNIQYRQPGGQWTTHPTRPTEDDTLQLDIDDLEPGTFYEIRINAKNEYGTSIYTSAIVTTDTGTFLHIDIMFSIQMFWFGNFCFWGWAKEY
ncbi:nephrin-like [Haliotis rubra]|uniref:nephrin-like n=1 Tax=Haliotis rubra TaxID=36100 RepID=UPI001EE626CF|nr:nephrin-like [Haliotis rubra]